MFAFLFVQTVVNKSLTSGIFPQPWKEAKISPIFKTGSKDDVNNYRPISILPTLSKIIEKWIQKHFINIPIVSTNRAEYLSSQNRTEQNITLFKYNISGHSQVAYENKCIHDN